MASNTIWITSRGAEVQTIRAIRRQVEEMLRKEDGIEIEDSQRGRSGKPEDGPQQDREELEERGVDNRRETHSVASKVQRHTKEQSMQKLVNGREVGLIPLIQ